MMAGSGSFTGVLFRILLYYHAFLSVVVWPFQSTNGGVVQHIHQRNRQRELRRRQLDTETNIIGTCWPLFSTDVDSALSTTRIPLQRIFNNERDYLFTTRRNVRSFEWTTKEVEELFESILCLEGDADELELNAITILPKAMTKLEKTAIGRVAKIYDVSQCDICVRDDRSIEESYILTQKEEELYHYLLSL
jgi:hypothetical protein